METQVDQARKAAEALGGIADLTTWLGALGPFGEWLGWPDWYFEGTEIDVHLGIPSTTSYRDGLIINANIIENGKCAELIERTLASQRLVTGPDAALVVRNAPTLREACRSLVALLSITNPCVKLHRNVVRNKVKIRIVEQIDSGKILGFYSAIRIILFIRTMQRFLIDDFSEMRISLTLSKSEAGSSLESGLGAEIEFGANHNCISYPAHWEQKRNFDYEVGLWRLALSQIETLENRVTALDFPHKLQRYVATVMQNEKRVPRLKELAAQENLSVRSLNRSLADSGIKYQDIVDDVRQSAISKMMVNSSMTLSEMARDTGFSNSSSFARSFKTWFGESPSEYRYRLLGGR